MPTLSIKDVPEPVAAALRQRAALNHRSLQGELMAIIEEAAGTALSLRAATRPEQAPAAPSHEGRRVRRGRKTIEQIHAEHLARFPAPIQGPRAVDLIREDRDAR